MAGDLTGFQQYLANYAARDQAAREQFQQQEALRNQIHTGGLLGFFTDRPSAVAHDAPIRAALQASYAPGVRVQAQPVGDPPRAGVVAQPVAPPTTVSPITGDSVAAYGQLSPAARAVLSNLNPGAVQAADKANADKTAAALQGVPTFAQLMAGYASGNGGKISLRAIDALAGAAQKGAAAGSATRKLPSIADVAGAQALQLGSELFEQQKAAAIKSGDKDAYLKAALEHQDRLERLARARAIDPVTQYGFNGQSE